MKLRRNLIATFGNSTPRFVNWGLVESDRASIDCCLYVVCDVNYSDLVYSLLLFIIARGADTRNHNKTKLLIVEQMLF